MCSDQSCPRVNFLGPDPAKRWPDPRLPTKVWPNSTRPLPSNVLLLMSSTLNVQVVNRNNNHLLHDFVGMYKQWKIFLFRSSNVSRGWKKSISNGLISQEWSYFEAKKDCKYQMLVHSRFEDNLSRSILWSLNSFHPSRVKQTSVTSQSASQTRPNAYEFNYCFIRLG